MVNSEECIGGVLVSLTKSSSPLVDKPLKYVTGS